jgi:hypothetical protein
MSSSIFAVVPMARATFYLRNRSMQQQLNVHLQAAEPLKSIPSADSNGTLPWLGLIESSRTVGFSIRKYCRATD